MIAFFLTMPISVISPMIAITLKSKPKMHSQTEGGTRFVFDLRQEWFPKADGRHSRN